MFSVAQNSGASWLKACTQNCDLGSRPNICVGVSPNPVFVRQKLGVVRSEGSKVARETVISNRSPHLAPPLDGVVSSPTPTFHLGNHYTSGATTLYHRMGNHCISLGQPLYLRGNHTVPWDGQQLYFTWATIIPQGATTLYLGMGNHCTWTPGAIGNHYHTCLLWATTESWAHCTLGNHSCSWRVHLWKQSLFNIEWVSSANC